MAATVEGVEKLTTRLKKISQSAVNDIEQALITSALFVERDAKIKAAVDTGTMRSEITHKPGGIGTDSPYVDVISPVEYSVHVEFGTSKQAAQPFMYPALIENKSKILKEIAKALKKGVGL